MALPKANRLRRSQDFSAVYQKGRRHKSEHLTLRLLRHRPVIPVPVKRTGEVPQGGVLASSRPTRIGVSISTKVSKRSVVRNLLKRRILGIFYRLLPRFPAGWDLVIVVHPTAVECDYAQILRELEQVLAHAID